MSKATKRKHVTKEVMDDYVVPDDNQQIVKVLAGRGNNLHEVETKEGEHFLVSMPSKFRKNVWIKRGDFVIVDPIEEGNKVCAEIVYILYPKQIKYLKEEDLWPEAFTEKPCEGKEAVKEEKEPADKGLPPTSDTHDDTSSVSGTDDEDDDDDLFVNTNRPPPITYSDESDSSGDDGQEG